MSAKKKGLAQLKESRTDEILSLTIFGGIIGGITNKQGIYKFEILGVIEGAATFALSGFMASSTEAIAGFLIYNVEGALLATLASSSYEAACLTLLSSLSFSYQVMLTSAFTGTIIGLVKEGLIDYYYVAEKFEQLSHSFKSNTLVSSLVGNIDIQEPEII